MIGFVGKERTHAAYYIVINVQSHQVYMPRKLWVMSVEEFAATKIPAEEGYKLLRN